MRHNGISFPAREATDTFVGLDRRPIQNIETIAMDCVNTAYERRLKSDARYRFVMDMQRLK